MARIVYNGISPGQIDAFCLSRGYSDIINSPSGSIPNPQTKLGFMEQSGRSYFEAECARGKKLMREETRRLQDIADASSVIFTSGTIE